ncbi:hypothetical protein SOPP22_17755 [Shewanella sp. OPT22]|nr:hypothetical protein SOPP22_17755 [Shewanella sp. OPT22]
MFVAFTATADYEAIRLSRFIGNLNMHEAIYKAVDEQCLTDYSVTKEQLTEINDLSVKKTGLTYKEFTVLVGDSEVTRDLANQAIKGLIENKCNPMVLRRWHSISLSDFNEEIENLRDAVPTKFFVK